MRTLFAEEQYEKGRERRERNLVEAKARKKSLKFFVGSIEPKELFRKAKYLSSNDGSFIHYTDKKGTRFHAYVIGKDEIDIHLDRVFMSDKGIWHKSTSDTVKDEIKRLQAFMPGVVKIITAKKKQYRTQILRHDLMKKAFEDLKKLQLA